LNNKAHIKKDEEPQGISPRFSVLFYIFKLLNTLYSYFQTAIQPKDTFCGACHELMSKLITKYPDATIVIMTPLHRETEDIPSTGNSRPLSDYVEMIRKTAEFYSLPVIDLWAISGIQPKVDVIKKKYCPDGLHPNDAGHIKMAERIAGCLLTL